MRLKLQLSGLWSLHPRQLTLAAFTQAPNQLDSCGFRQGKLQGHQTAVFDAKQLGVRHLKLAPHHTFQGVRHAAGQAGLFDQWNLLRCEQGLSHRIGIGPHQTACPKLDAAKIAHHCGQYTLQILVTQHFQHRPTGRAAWLAIVIGC